MCQTECTRVPMSKAIPLAALLFALWGCQGNSKNNPSLPISVATLNNSVFVHYEEKDSGFFWVRNVRSSYVETVQTLSQELSSSYNVKSNKEFQTSHFFSMDGANGKSVIVNVFPGRTEAQNLEQTVRGTESEWTTVMVATSK